MIFYVAAAIHGHAMVERLSHPLFEPLRFQSLEHLEKTVDFEKVRALTELKLFVAATNVHTGRIKVFEGPELTADHVMASACLPYLFQAVEIDGVPYWDGGFMGNPALFPLFCKTACPDIVIVQLTRSNGTRRHARRPTFRID